MSELNDQQRDDLRDIQERSEKLRETYGERDRMLEEMRKMYHMEWDDQPGADWIKETMSPSAYDTLTGAVRLMTSTEPKFNVSYDESDADLKAMSTEIEAAASTMWAGSGRVWGRPIHYEMILSSLWAAEIIGSVSRTADLVTATQGMSKRRYRRQAEEAVRQTPYLFQISNPLEAYTEYSMLGPSAVLRRSETTWGDVLSIYGKAAEEQDDSRRKSDSRVTLYDWTDYDYHAAWVDGSTEPLLFEVQDLPFMPIVSTVTDGSFLFNEPHQNRTPFLYGLWKSNLWRRENLMLTVIYSLVHGVGSWPLLVHETQDPDNDKLQINRGDAGRFVSIERGDKLFQLIERVIDPSQMQGLATAQQYNEGTTIPRVALGAPPSGNLAFSAISTLIQSGRLPLMGTKQSAAYTAAEMVRRGLLWLKYAAQNPGQVVDLGNGMGEVQRSEDELYTGKGRRIQLDPLQIPDRLPINCVLEVSLPSDKLQQVNAANGAVQNGLTSKRWARENVLGEGQNDAMEREIIGEQFTQAAAQLYLQRMSAQAQASMQQMQQAQGAASAQSMVNGIPESRPPMPAEISSSQGAYPPGGVQPGAPMAGPLPPRGQA